MNEPETPLKRRGSFLALWVGAGLLWVGALVGTAIILGNTVYSAPAFVERYIAAIASDDIASALNTAGVDVDGSWLEEAGYSASTSRALLRSGVIDEAPSDVRVVSEEVSADGTHVVTLQFELGGVKQQSSFSVAPVEPLAGILPRWRFVESPLTVIDVTVQHGGLFTVGDLTLDTRAAKPIEEVDAFVQTAPYLAIAPARYVVSYDSPRLTAAPVGVDALPGELGVVSIDVQPTEKLVADLQKELDEFLAECVTQKVLQPAGCPFGAVINDRVLSEPTWSIVSNPVVTLVPGETAFEMPPTQGVVHLVVEVQSLFDGSLETVDRDETYQVGLLVTVRTDGSLAIQLK